MATNPLPQAPWGDYVPRVASMTVEQFEYFPMEDGRIYELHEGRLVSMLGPGRIHGQIQTKLTLMLSHYLTAHQLGSLTGTSCYNLPSLAIVKSCFAPIAPMYYQPAKQGS